MDGSAVVAEAEAAPYWRCFHCTDVFTDPEEAADHFGREWFCEDDGPACIQILTEGEKAIVNSRREAGRLMREAEAEAEKLEGELQSLRWEKFELTRRYGKHGGEGSSLGHILESLEGRALAAEAALNAAPGWLRTVLRRRAEWRWKRARARTDRLRRAAEAAA